MNRRSHNYFYKACDIEKMSPIDKKRYEYLNEFGYNMDSNKKRYVDYDLKVIRHKNSESR